MYIFSLSVCSKGSENVPSLLASQMVVNSIFDFFLVYFTAKNNGKQENNKPQYSTKLSYLRPEGYKNHRWGQTYLWWLTDDSIRHHFKKPSNNAFCRFFRSSKPPQAVGEIVDCTMYTKRCAVHKVHYPVHWSLVVVLKNV